MDTFCLPPSPSWQLSKILACNEDGLLAYGSRSEVAIIDSKPGTKFDVSFINLAHKEKINVVVFSPSKGSFKNCLSTCGDDGLVRVWDFKESRLLFCHPGHKDGVRVTGLDWSTADTNRIVSVNDLGSIVCWDLASNTIRRLHCGTKVLPLCLACCPHEKELIAVGCKGGITLVVDVKGNGKIVHRLRGHEQDVTSLSWCPVPYSVIKHKREMGGGGDPGVAEGTEKSRELLLATGGLDKSIFIWRTGSDGRFEVMLCLPNTSMSNNTSRKKGMNNTLLWTCVLWADPYTLLSTSQFGELLLWDLNRVFPNSDKSNYKKPQPRLLHSKHYKGCFSIACPILAETVDIKDDRRLVWTTAMDKHLVGCKLSTGSVVLDIPTMGGVVFSMALSPLDPNRLAIGTSDSKVFVWNVSDLNSLHINTYWRKIIGRVMALSWHPREENWLAYGTSDGHIGVIDVGSNKLPTLFRLHHRKQVYRLCWAPPILPLDTDHGDKLALYSVGDGDVFQYTADITEPNKEPFSLNSAMLNGIDQSLKLQKNLVRSEIVFKPDNSSLAVGNDNGSVYILNCKTFSLQHVIYPHKKLMNNLEWHPETVASDNSISPYRNWLATTCDNVRVYDIPPEGQPELIATLSGHSEKIVGLCWSPHYNGRLLSASYDFSVQIWDVPSQSLIGVYLAHSMAVMCALFSPLDPDIVISGSSDNSVRLWRISELPSTVKPEKKKGRVENKLKKMREEAQEATELTVGMSDISLISEDGEESKENSSTNSSFNSSSQSYLPSTNKEDYKKRQKSRAVFSITEPKLTQAKHFDVLYKRWISSSEPTPPPESQLSTTSAIHITSALPTTSAIPTNSALPITSALATTASTSDAQPEETETPSAADLGYLDFFGDEKAMQRLLMVEEDHLTQNKQNQLAQQSMLWRGDVSQLITQAITKKQLSDWLISVAPIVGFDVWEKACEAYAAQLVDCGEVIKASSYLLAVHKVHEAIRLLADYKHFREAIAIAKCRLPLDDQLTAEVYTEWGNVKRFQGCMYLAAHCYLAAGNTQACIETLARIKELKALKMATTLASHQGLPELAASLATECLNMAVVAGNLAVGHQLVSEMPHYQYWNVWLRASEAVAKVKNRSESEALSWLAGWQQAPVSLWDHLSTTCNSLGPCYNKLLTRLPTIKTPDYERDLWYIVSGQLAAAWAAKVEASPAVSLRHIVTGLSAAFHYQEGHPSSTALLLTLAIIAPNGLFTKENILSKDYETVEERQVIKSLKAFVCAAIVHWISNNWEKVSKLKFKVTENNKTEGDSNDGGGFKVDWLTEMLTRCSAEALDAENISFFIKKAQKQELQNLVTKENIKNSVEKKIEGNTKEKREQTNTKVEKVAMSKTEDKLEKQSSNEKIQSTERSKVDENLNLTSEKKMCSELVDTPKMQEDTRKTNKIIETKDKTKSESDIVSNVSEKAHINSNGDAKHTTVEEEQLSSTSKENSKLGGKSDDVSEKSNGSIVKQNLKEDVDMTSPKSSKENEDEITLKLKEIEILKEVLSKFEHERVSVPSPFTAYTNIKYVIENVISKHDPKAAKQLEETCDNLWKKYVP